MAQGAGDALECDTESEGAASELADTVDSEGSRSEEDPATAAPPYRAGVISIFDAAGVIDRAAASVGEVAVDGAEAGDLEDSGAYATVDADGAAATLPVASADEECGIEDGDAACIGDAAAADAGAGVQDESAAGARVDSERAATTLAVAGANEEGGEKAGAVTGSAGLQSAAVSALTPGTPANGARTGVARGRGIYAGLPGGRFTRCTPLAVGFVKDLSAPKSFPVPSPDGDAPALLDDADCLAFAAFPGVAL